MSYQIKPLSSAWMTAGAACGNFPSTIYAQSSTWVPAGTPAPAGRVAAKRARRAGAPAHHELNRLPGRLEMHFAPSWRAHSLGAKAGKMLSGGPMLDADKGTPLDDRKRGRPRPTRAILIGGLLEPGRAVKREDHRNMMIGPFQAASSLVEQPPFGPPVGPATKLAQAQRKVGRLGRMLFV